MGRQQLRNFPPSYLLQFSHLGSCFEFLPCLPEAFDQELGVVRWNKSFSPQLAFGQCLVTVAWMQTKAIRVLCVGAFPRLAESQPGAEFRSVLSINLLQGLISLRLLFTLSRLECQREELLMILWSVEFMGVWIAALLLTEVLKLLWLRSTCLYKQDRKTYLREYVQDWRKLRSNTWYRQSLIACDYNCHQ